MGKMEDEPRECPTRKDGGSCMQVAILDGPAGVGAAVVDGGSPETSAILELGKVVG